MKSAVGKIFAALIVLLTLLIVAVAVVGIGNSISLNIAGRIAEVHTSGFGGSRFLFSLDEIVSVTTIDTFPSARRTNGTTNLRISSGRFDVTGQGAGLGLPITRLLVENIGGKIFVDVTQHTFAVYSSFLPKSCRKSEYIARRKSNVGRFD